MVDDDFTIISNNCWGGTVYESYGIKKMSPTVGMFIMPKDYLKMISNLSYYLAQPLKFVHHDNSKWRKELEHKSNWGTYLIGKLDDIELHMLHYHSEEIAKKKWESRVNRVNWDKLIFKFNDQNGATIEDIDLYLKMPLQHKLCFVVQKELKLNDDVILIKQKGEKRFGIKASREPLGRSRSIDITSYINKLG